MAASGEMLKALGRPARRAAAGAVVLVVTFAGGAAIGLGGADSNGRDGSTVPGEPTDAPAPVDVDDGRVGSSPVARSSSELSTTESSEAVSALAAIADNGRGGPDPASGPNPLIAAATESVAAAESGSIDTDSGKAPTRDANRPSRSRTADADGAAAETVYVDQDVPGAPTGGPDGADEPSNDADG